MFGVEREAPPGAAEGRDMKGKDGALRALLVVFGVSQLALGLLMVVAPGTFFEEIGPYGTRNDHYLGDLASFYLALGAVALVASRRPPWRVPVLAYATLHYALHSLNHAIDVGEADPSWLGPANLASLVLTGGLLGWLLVVANRSDAEARR
jgi:hypothetical protein